MNGLTGTGTSGLQAPGFWLWKDTILQHHKPSRKVYPCICQQTLTGNIPYYVDILF
jgi:hypothetical protein